MATDAPAKAKADNPVQPPAHKDVRTPADLSREVTAASTLKPTGAPTDRTKAGASPTDQTKTATDKPVSSDKPATDKPAAGDKLKPTDSSLPVVNLTDQAVSTAAKELHDSISRSTLGISRPDSATTDRILNSLTAEQRTRLEKEYHDQFDPNGPPDSLRRDMKGKFSEAQFRRSEGLLERKDGETNDAANLKSALAETDPDVRDAKLRSIYKTLTSTQIDDMNKKFESRYGQKADDEVGKLHLNPGTKEALDVYRKGSDKVTSEDLVSLARVGAKGGLPKSAEMGGLPNGHTQNGSDILKESLAGDSPQAKAARETLRNDKDFQKDLVTHYNRNTQPTERVKGPDDLIDPVIRDSVRDGRIQLDTIANANRGVFGNKETVDIAVRTTTPEEQQKFQQGWRLSQPGAEAKTPEEKAAKDFYTKVQDKFEAAGNKGDVERWKATLLNGGKENVITDMAKTETSGMFGSSHSPKELIDAARNLRPEDWQKLHNAAKGQGDAKKQGEEFRTQVEQFLTKVAPAEKQRVLDMLTEKANKDSFAESQKVGRSLGDALSDTKTPTMFGTTVTSPRDVARTIAGMTKEQAADYKSNPDVRKQVDESVKAMRGDTKLLAERLLGDVAKTGEPPKLEGSNKLIYDAATGANPKTLLADAEAALKDPEYRAKLQGDPTKMDPADKRARQAIEGSIFQQLGNTPQRVGDKQQFMDTLSMLQASKDMASEMIGKGRLELDTKDRLGFDRDEVYKDMKNASPAEREKFINGPAMEGQPEVQQLARKIASQDGEMRLEDKVRSFVLQGSPKEKAPEIAKAIREGNPDEVVIARNTYAREFKADMAADVQKHLPDGERAEVRDKINPPDDGRQKFYDNYSQYLKNRGGITFSGSALTLERTATMHQQAEQMYNQNRDKLSEQQRKDLDGLFGKALEEHKDDKEKATQIMVDAAITAATMTASGGLVTAAMAARVGLGGAFQAAAMGMAREEFDPQKGMSDFVKGGVATCLGAIPGMGKVAERAEAGIVAGAGERLPGKLGGNAERLPGKGEELPGKLPTGEQKPIAPVKAPEEPAAIPAKPPEARPDVTEPRPVNDSTLAKPAAVAAEKSPEALKAEGQQLGRQYAEKRLGEVKDGLVADPAKLEKAQAATAEAKQKMEDAVLAANTPDAAKTVQTALDRMRDMEKLTNPGNKAIKSDAAFAEKYGRKEGESEEAWMKRAMQEVNKSVKSSTDKLSALQRVQEATPETQGLDQAAKRLKDLEGAGIVTKGKSDALNGIKDLTKPASENPDLLARAHDIIDNKALTQEQREKQLLDLAGTTNVAERMRKLEDTILRTSDNPTEAKAALNRLQQKVEERTRTENILSPSAMKNIEVNFERSVFSGGAAEKEAQFKLIAGQLYKDNPEAAANFQKTLSEFYSESNGKDFARSIVKGPDGRYTLLRACDASSTSGGLKVYVADIGADGKAIGPGATKNEFHVIFEAPKTSAAKDAAFTGEPPQITQIKYEADGKKVPLYQKGGNPEYTPSGQYPFDRSQWAGATEAETVNNIRQFLNGVFQRSRQ